MMAIRWFRLPNLKSWTKPYVIQLLLIQMQLHSNHFMHRLTMIIMQHLKSPYIKLRSGTQQSWIQLAQTHMVSTRVAFSLTFSHNSSNLVTNINRIQISFKEWVYTTQLSWYIHNLTLKWYKGNINKLSSIPVSIVEH